MMSTLSLMLIVVAARAQGERAHTFQGNLPQEHQRSLKVPALKDSGPSPASGHVETPGLSQALSKLLLAFNPAAGRPMGQHSSRRSARSGKICMDKVKPAPTSLSGVTILNLWNTVAADLQKAVPIKEKKLLQRMDEVKIALGQMGTPARWGDWGTPDELIALSKSQTCNRPVRFVMPSDVLAIAPVWYRESMSRSGNPKLDEIATKYGLTEKEYGAIPVVKIREIIPSPVLGPVDWMPSVEVMEEIRKELLMRLVMMGAAANRPLVIEHANDWSEERYRALGFERMDEDYMVYGGPPPKDLESTESFDMAVLQKH
mmetsp:Transcript_116914/g.202968  ORF Transcript_116914/g.202968 Transcript_116914/m.202968 type:complete len:316 (+) Transcript_116914:47-994(+)